MIAATNVFVIFWNFLCRILMYCILTFLKLRSISLLPNIDVVHFYQDELTL